MSALFSKLMGLLESVSQKFKLHYLKKEFVTERNSACFVCEIFNATSLIAVLSLILSYLVN